MLFGQSVFQSVLDRLEAEKEEEAPEDRAPSHRIRGLNTGFASTVLEGVSVASARPDQAYVDNLGEEPVQEPKPHRPAESAPPPAPKAVLETVKAVEQPAPPPVMPPHLKRIRPEQVAAELALSESDTQQSLNDKRRAFAKANHPDRIAPDFRDNATIRMKIANLLIDEASRRLAIIAKLRR